MYKVSIIIPVYNSEKYLEQCLESACGQTLKDIEIICVNDASSDNSFAILKEFEKKDKRLKIVNHEKNQGESTARNNGLKRASGEYIAFLDNDDRIDLNFCEKLYKQAKRENADISKGNICTYDFNGKKIETKSLNELIQEKDDKMYFIFNWWTAIYRRALIENNNLIFPEALILGGDVVFLNKALIASNKLTIVDDVFYYYYRRKNSGDSKMLSLKKVKSNLKAYEMIIDNINCCDPKMLNEEAYKFIYKNFFIATLNIMFRNKSIESKKITFNAILDFYDKSKYKKDLLKNISSYNQSLPKYFLNKDFEGLFNILSKCESKEKILLTELRNKAKANFISSTKKFTG